MQNVLYGYIYLEDNQKEWEKNSYVLFLYNLNKFISCYTTVLLLIAP